MYDALLEEFEDDTTRTPEEEDGFALQPLAEVEVEEVDDEFEPVDGAVDQDVQVKVDDEGDLLAGLDDNESWSDDPVRMYLTQMGEIPLLTRQQEIHLAKQIEVTRRRFRPKLLECDYVIQAAFKVLKRVHDGELPFDRTVQVSVTDQLEKDQILGRLAAQPADARNAAQAQSPRLPHRAEQVADARRSAKQAWKRLGAAPSQAVRLVEELGLRTQRIEPMIRTLEEFSRRVDELKTKIDAAKSDKQSADQREPWLARVSAMILLACQETPTSLRNRVTYPEADLRRVPAGQARAVGRQPAAGRLDRQEVSQPRPELPGSDSGRQRRPDAGGRQVRVSPRLQVLHLRHVVDSPGDHPGRGRPEPHDPHSGAHGRDHVARAQRLAPAAAGTGPRADDRRKRPGEPKTTVDEARRVLAMSRYPISLDRPVGNSEDSHFGDLLPDGTAESPAIGAAQEMLRGRINKVLKTLSYREREIIKLRYGLGDGYSYTLEEVGHIFKVTRERIRQIEAKAVRKLQQPSRSQELVGFLD